MKSERNTGSVLDSAPATGTPAGAPSEVGYLAAEIAGMLTRAAKGIRGGMFPTLAPLGLTPAQAGILRHLTESSAESLRMRDLADALRIVPRSVTSFVDALEADGFVVRQADAADRRSVRVALTEAGRRIAREAAEARRATVEVMLQRLSRAEREQLYALLSKLDEPGCVRESSGEGH